MMRYMDTLSLQRLYMFTIQMIDPFVKDIAKSGSSVELLFYNFKEKQWCNSDIRGTIFVYNRCLPPCHCICIYNQGSKTAFIDPIEAEMIVWAESKLLLYKKSQKHLNAIGFVSNDECKDFVTFVQNIKNRLAYENFGMAAAAAAAAGNMPGTGVSGMRINGVANTNALTTTSVLGEVEAEFVKKIAEAWNYNYLAEQAMLEQCSINMSALLPKPADILMNPLLFGGSTNGNASNASSVSCSGAASGGASGSGSNGGIGSNNNNNNSCGGAGSGAGGGGGGGGACGGNVGNVGNATGVGSASAASNSNNLGMLAGGLNGNLPPTATTLTASNSSSGLNCLSGLGCMGSLAGMPPSTSTTNNDLNGLSNLSGLAGLTAFINSSETLLTRNRAKLVNQAISLQKQQQQDQQLMHEQQALQELEQKQDELQQESESQKQQEQAKQQVQDQQQRDRDQLKTDQQLVNKLMVVQQNANAAKTALEIMHKVATKGSGMTVDSLPKMRDNDKAKPAQPETTDTAEVKSVRVQKSDTAATTATELSTSDGGNKTATNVSVKGNGSERTTPEPNRRPSVVRIGSVEDMHTTKPTVNQHNNNHNSNNNNNNNNSNNNNNNNHNGNMPMGKRTLKRMKKLHKNMGLAQGGAVQQPMEKLDKTERADVQPPTETEQQASKKAKNTKKAGCKADSSSSDNLAKLANSGGGGKHAPNSGKCLANGGTSTNRAKKN